MVLLRMHAAVGDEAEEMKLAAALAGKLQGPQDNWMPEEFPARDQLVDARDVHADDPAGSDVEVADFAVAHLAVRQAHEVIGSVQKGARELRKQLVVVGLARQRDGVVLDLRTIAPSVEDGEDNGSALSSDWALHSCSCSFRLGIGAGCDPRMRSGPRAPFTSAAAWRVVASWNPNRWAWPSPVAHSAMKRASSAKAPAWEHALPDTASPRPQSRDGAA